MINSARVFYAEGANHTGIISRYARNIKTKDLTRKRRATGRVSWMKEPYDEDLASHIGPESCGGGSNGTAEALTGVRAGQVLSREILVYSRVPTEWVSRKAIPAVLLSRDTEDPARSKTLARTETHCTGTGRSYARPRERDRGPHREV